MTSVNSSDPGIHGSGRPMPRSRSFHRLAAAVNGVPINASFRHPVPDQAPLTRIDVHVGPEKILGLGGMGVKSPAVLRSAPRINGDSLVLEKIKTWLIQLSYNPGSDFLRNSDVPDT